MWFIKLWSLFWGTLFIFNFTLMMSSIFWWLQMLLLLWNNVLDRLLRRLTMRLLLLLRWEYLLGDLYMRRNLLLLLFHLHLLLQSQISSICIVWYPSWHSTSSPLWYNLLRLLLWLRLLSLQSIHRLNACVHCSCCCVWHLATRHLWLKLLLLRRYSYTCSTNLYIRWGICSWWGDHLPWNTWPLWKGRLSLREAALWGRWKTLRWHTLRLFLLLLLLK